MCLCRCNRHTPWYSALSTLLCVLCVHVHVDTMQGAIPWDPHTLERAMEADTGDAEMQVLDCYNFSDVTITQRAFFTGWVVTAVLTGHTFYGVFVMEGPRACLPCMDRSNALQRPRCDAAAAATAAATSTRYLQGHVAERIGRDRQVQREPVMYKIKDWPPSSDIREKLCRHYAVSDAERKGVKMDSCWQRRHQSVRKACYIRVVVGGCLQVCQQQQNVASAA